MHNVRSILTDYRDAGESIWARFNGGREGTLWYYRVLLDEFRRSRPNRITQDFELAVQPLRSGANDYIQKPIDRDYFIASLSRAIQCHQLSRQVATQDRQFLIDLRVPDPCHAVVIGGGKVFAIRAKRQ